MRLFYLGADVAVADGKPEAAAELCLDLARLGTVVANSGGFQDYDAGIACYNIAVEKLAPVCSELDVATCRRLIQGLDGELAKLDSAEVIAHRGSAALGSRQDTNSSEAAAANGTLLRMQSQAYHAREMMCRTLSHLCRVKLSLRMHFLQQGRFPRSLQNLERTGILQQLPEDYWREGGFVYRLRGNDYLLYSVGPDRRDDGGKQVDRNSLLAGAAGDLVL